jgi:hypothetical protein
LLHSSDEPTHRDETAMNGAPKMIDVPPARLKAVAL